MSKIMEMLFVGGDLDVNRQTSSPLIVSSEA